MSTTNVPPHRNTAKPSDTRKNDAHESLAFDATVKAPLPYEELDEPVVAAAAAALFALVWKAEKLLGDVELTFWKIRLC
jgi:hypothetical protein